MPEIIINQIEHFEGTEELSETFREYQQFIYELKKGDECYKVRLLFKQKVNFVTVEVFSKKELSWNHLLQISVSEMNSRRSVRENFGYYREGDENLLLGIAEKILF